MPPGCAPTRACASPRIVGLRIIYLGLDQSRDGAPVEITGPNGEALAKNPLKDRRVREALSIAINRAAIVDRVMEGAAIPTGQFLPPGSFSYVPDLKPPRLRSGAREGAAGRGGIPERLPHHVARSERPLRQRRAHHPDGRADVVAHRRADRGRGARHGRTSVGHANKQDYPAFLLGWGSSSGEASNPLRSLVATFNTEKGCGAANRGRYSNPGARRADRQGAGDHADDAARERVLQDATRMVFEDVGIIPLHNQKNVWATRADLVYTPRADEETRAQELRPAK